MPTSKKITLQSSLGSSPNKPLALVEKRESSPVRPGPPSRQRNGSRLVMAMGMAALMLASLPESLLAQSSTTSNPPGEPEGVNSAGYVIHSSGEIGYRSTNLSGSVNMYDTLVNLQSGPRLLDETVSMQSITHQGVLFDNLYVSSFGWGGDPNNVLRARIDKNKWYNFVGSFRRDQNFSDFDLLANPLNPPTSTPYLPVLNSPHLFDTTRRMSDVDLTLLPQSRVSFRLGYSHNNMTGPSYSSIHEGTEALLLQDWNTTMNSYRLGVDFRVAPRTVLSYDQFLDYYKGDTDYQLNPINEVLIPTTHVVPVRWGFASSPATKNPAPMGPP